MATISAGTCTLAFPTDNAPRRLRAARSASPGRRGGHDGRRVADPWHENYDNAPSDGSVWQDEAGPRRHVVRGGAWYFDAKELRLASRTGPPSGLQDGNIGFRVARTLPGTP